MTDLPTESYWKDALPDTVQVVQLDSYKTGGLLDKVQPRLPGD